MREEQKCTSTLHLYLSSSRIIVGSLSSKVVAALKNLEVIASLSFFFLGILEHIQGAELMLPLRTQPAVSWAHTKSYTFESQDHFNTP